MRRLKAIIFDMDGTLADTEEIHRQAFNLAFTEFNLPWQWSPSEYKRLLAVSGGRERIRYYMDRHQPVVYQTGMALKVHQRKSEIYRQKLRDGHVRLRTGVEHLIGEALDRNIMLGIATSSSRRNVETLLKVALGNDALKLFSTIVTCDTVEVKKPAPAAYLYALAALGLDARHCIALEDTHNGNLAALAAGIATVITTHRFTTDDDFTGTSLVLDQLGEPDNPFTVLSGDPHGHRYVTVDLLERLLEDQPEQADWPEPAVIAASEGLSR